MLEFTHERKWLKPHTSKRYLQPPLCGWLCTQWPDFKLVISDLYTTGIPKPGYQDCPASGVLLLVNDYSVDFHTTKMLPREDGIPIHAMQGKADGLEIFMENFCTPDAPDTYIWATVSVKNPSNTPKTVRLALLPRSGREDHLIGMATDGYMHYNGNQKNLGFLPRTFSYENGVISDERSVISVENGDFSAAWVEDENGRPWDLRGILELTAELSAQQEKSFRFSFRPVRFSAKPDYEADRKRTLEFWQKELGRIRILPNAEQPLCRNMIAQLLQFIAYFPDNDTFAPRQGGMNRFTWPAEAMEFLEPLGMLGDFDDYIEKSISFYFDKMQVKEGEEKGSVIVRTGWASSTAAAIYSAACAILQSGERAYSRWKEPMYEGFLWMQRQRAKSYEVECEGKGIFPPCRGTDWPGEFQCWAMTDAYNLLGYEKMALAFEKMADPRAAEIRAAYEDYLACEKKILARIVAENPKKDELLLPNRLGCRQTDPPAGAYLIDGPAALLRAGVIDADSETARLCENYFIHRGLFQNGLTGLMTDGLMRSHSLCDPWAGHTWYTSMGDYCWFLTWLRQGRREDAEKTLAANLKYGVTDAFYLGERFADNDPYFTPWQPNASANGRMLSMLIALYGTKEV